MAKEFIQPIFPGPPPATGGGGGGGYSGGGQGMNFNMESILSAILAMRQMEQQDRNATQDRNLRLELDDRETRRTRAWYAAQTAGQKAQTKLTDVQRKQIEAAAGHILKMNELTEKKANAELAAFEAKTDRERIEYQKQAKEFAEQRRAARRAVGESRKWAVEYALNQISGGTDLPNQIVNKALAEPYLEAMKQTQKIINGDRVTGKKMADALEASMKGREVARIVVDNAHELYRGGKLDVGKLASTMVFFPDLGKLPSVVADEKGARLFMDRTAEALGQETFASFNKLPATEGQGGQPGTSQKGPPIMNAQRAFMGVFSARRLSQLAADTLSNPNPQASGVIGQTDKPDAVSMTYNQILTAAYDAVKAKDVELKSHTGKAMDMAVINRGNAAQRLISDLSTMGVSGFAERIRTGAQLIENRLSATAQVHQKTAVMDLAARAGIEKKLADLTGFFADDPNRQMQLSLLRGNMQQMETEDPASFRLLMEQKPEFASWYYTGNLLQNPNSPENLEAGVRQLISSNPRVARALKMAPEELQKRLAPLAEMDTDALFDTRGELTPYMEDIFRGATPTTQPATDQPASLPGISASSEPIMTPPAAFPQMPDDVMPGEMGPPALIGG